MLDTEIPNPCRASSAREVRFLPRTFEMRLDLLQRLSFRFRQEHGGSDEINHGAARKAPKHGGIAILSYRGQKYGGNTGGNGLVNQQGNAHAVRSNAGGHQFRERQPHTDSRADRKKGHKYKKSNSDLPSTALAGQGSNKSVIDSQRREARSV